MWVSQKINQHVILVHSAGIPDQAEFDKTCHELMNGCTHFIIFAYGDSTLTTKQRKSFSETAAAAKVHVSAILENRLQRSMATAVGWFVSSLKVFSFTETDLAKAYEFAQAQSAELRELVIQLHSAAGVDVPALLPASATSANAGVPQHSNVHSSR